ncbi:MAG TPA: substrate-binding domain-containing protein [Bacteroidales bacterium]|nr:substrate-binding domain-containing protein [Bacteroidales bacterium]
MKRVFLFLLGAIFFVSITGCQRARKSGFDKDGNLQGRISISGAWAMYPLVVRWAEEFRKLHPNVQIDISAGGAGKGMADVLNNMVDLAMVSREINPDEIAQNAWFVAAAKDAVVPTFNTTNPNKEALLSQGLTRSQFQRIFLEEGTKDWSQFLPTGMGSLNVYTRSDASGAAETWAQFLGMAQEDLLGIGVFGDPGIADIVRNDVAGVGFNNIAFAYDIKTGLPFEGLGVIPIDLNEDGKINPEESFYGSLAEVMNAIAVGKFPSPPARNLYFVSHGEPTNVAVIEFLLWVMEHGQKYAPEAGYVAISAETIHQNLEMIPAAVE